MKTFLLIASLYAPAPSLSLVCAPPARSPAVNCVNPGGSCDGTVPCCGQNNFCVRNRCQTIPAQ